MSFTIVMSSHEREGYDIYAKKERKERIPPPDTRLIGFFVRGSYYYYFFHHGLHNTWGGVNSKPTRKQLGINAQLISIK